MRVLYIALITLVLFASQKTQAQTDPIYTQYLFNPFVYNPAYAGVFDQATFTAMTRYQQVGAGQYINTHHASLHSSFPNTANMGMGALVQVDNYGINRHIDSRIGYAYKLPINDYVTLSMGVQAAVINYSINYNRLTYSADGTSVYDPNYSDSRFSVTQVNFGTGFYLMSEDKYYLGFSAPRILNDNLNKQSSDFSQPRYNRQYYISGGYIFGAGGNMPVRPSFLVRYDENNIKSFSYDASCSVLLSQVLWAGVSVRDITTIGLMGQLDLTQYVRASFSYDLPLAKGVLSNNIGTFEFGFNANFGIFKNQTVTPRYF